MAVPVLPVNSMGNDRWGELDRLKAQADVEKELRTKSATAAISSSSARTITRSKQSLLIAASIDHAL